MLLRIFEKFVNVVTSDDAGLLIYHIRRDSTKSGQISRIVQERYQGYPYFRKKNVNPEGECERWEQMWEIDQISAPGFLSISPSAARELRNLVDGLAPKSGPGRSSAS